MKRKLLSDFKPHENKFEKIMGDLEASILEALWTLKVANVKNIHKEVAKKRKVAITTVATVLDRLTKKGLVIRELKRAGCLHYEYKPAITQKELEYTVVDEVLEGLFETFGDATVSRLTNKVGITDEKKLEEFKAYLKRVNSKRRI